MNGEKMQRYASGLCIRRMEEGTEGESRTVRGYAIRFNEESVVLDEWGTRFTEVIAPSCVTDAYLQECDIKMTLFHNREKLLARWNKGEGTLRLGVDEGGVWFEFDAPDTELGNQCLEGVRRGDLSGCSFTFVPKDYVTEERGQGDLLITHTAFAWLGEMTVESDPAYPTTSVEARTFMKSVLDNSESVQRARSEKASVVARQRAATERAKRDEEFLSFQF